MPDLRQFQWNLRDESEPPSTQSRQGSLRDRLLKLRTGSVDLDALGVGWDRLDGPEALPGADEAGEALAAAIADKRRIAIFGDYDVDGITASTLLRNLIRTLSPEAEVPIRLPNRYKEGYGLNTQALLDLRADGVDLVVTVDCGITSIAEVAAARAAGLEVIVSDHHDPLKDDEGNLVLPDATVVVHPRLPHPGRGFGELAGCGVAFKMGWAMFRAHCGSERVPKVLREALVEAMPFAALGTIADVVPLTDDNRVLAAQGLRLMPRTSNVGLRALLHACERSGTVDEEVVKFQIAPRINALGRLGSAQPVIDLFATDDPALAREIAEDMTRKNEQRKAEQEKLFERACERVEAEGQDKDDHPIIVLAEADWPQGLCGSAAAKVLERFHRPVVLLQDCDDGMARGSARSVPGYSIHDALKSCAELLEKFGGHDAAAGLTVRSDRVEELREALVAHAAEHRGTESRKPVLDVDCKALLSEVGSLGEIKEMNTLAPFGHGNPEPKILVEKVKAVEHRWIGSDRNHLKLKVVPQKAGHGSKTVDAIWFRAGVHRVAIDKALGEKG
ncbi:MAG: single-stranded-DNA-specific exonuclease RecJ, partial [Phycisphaerales bacterium]|nr:single-stranded-DNA-specific exonuclease RecJ [Phycisphaerales bacterium]